MLSVVQRVNSASVSVDNLLYSNIEQGLLVLLGIEENDIIKDADYLIDKILHLRIFNDKDNKMNRSVLDIQGEIMVVSQFTLLANTSKGRRPSFIKAANPKIAQSLYKYFLDELKKHNLCIQSGKFGAHMDINLVNNGPATFLLQSVV
tara:strand:+ start:2558 stop:3001 length:444 start_codon:yes stop_codon:yes gene_type:complete